VSPKAKLNTRQIRIFIPPDAYEKMRLEAEEKGASISGLARMIILEWYSKKNDEKK